uniref:Signal transduction histidine kinase subgroup 2 dimerisation and phosphoacceptor domain-containing protein n=1 Tax=mine drainage metagenome TaxID=410659 RepID=E6PK05_9ZZZZ
MALTLLLGAVLDLLRRGRERALNKALRMTQDLRRSEMAMRESLKQKDLLLQEVHHRMKNNLQLVHSLLDLQADAIGGGETLTRRRAMRRRGYGPWPSSIRCSTSRMISPRSISATALSCCSANCARPWGMNASRYRPKSSP